MDQELYKEHILNHYRNPHNKHELREADVVVKEVNMLCGDDVTLYAHVDGQGVVAAMSFTGEGCAVSQAAASLLTDYARGKHMEEIRRMEQSDMEQLLGTSFSMVRARCAMLPIKALLGNPISK